MDSFDWFVFYFLLILGVIAVESKLYVVGGDDGTANLTSVEVYDPETDQWTLLPSHMSLGRSYAGIALGEKPVQ